MRITLKGTLERRDEEFVYTPRGFDDFKCAQVILHPNITIFSPTQREILRALKEDIFPRMSSEQFRDFVNSL